MVNCWTTYLSGPLSQLTIIREEAVHNPSVVGFGPDHDLLDRKVFVVGHSQVTDLLSFDQALDP